MNSFPKITISLIALAIGGCGFSQKEPPKESPKEAAIVSGELHLVAKETIPWMVRTQGSLVSDEVATIGTKVPGRVVKTLVDLGDHVAAGAPLVQLTRRNMS